MSIPRHWMPAFLCAFFAHHCANLRPSLSCVREFLSRYARTIFSASGFLLRSLAPHYMRSPFLGSYAGFNPAYCVSVYWFISLLLASSTVRISFALRTSTSRLFRMFCFRGIPRFVLFCSPAIFLVVASGWHPDIPPLIVLCPAPSLPEFSSPPLGVLCARVSRARFPSSYVHSPALNAGFHFVHCAVFRVFLRSVRWSLAPRLSSW